MACSFGALAQLEPYPVKLLQEIDLPQPQQVINDLILDKNGLLYIIRTGQIIKYDGRRFQTIPWHQENHDDLIRGKFCNEKLYVYDYLGRLFFLQNDTMHPYPFNHLLVEFNPFHKLIDFYLDQKDTLHISYQNSSYIKIDPNGNITKPLINKGFKPSATICVIRDSVNSFLISSTSTPPKSKNRFYLLNKNLGFVDQVKVDERRFYLPPSLIRHQSSFLYSTGRGQLVYFNQQGIDTVISSRHKIGRIANYEEHAWFSDPEKGVFSIDNWLNKKQQYRFFYPELKTYVACASNDSLAWVYSTDGKLFQLKAEAPIYFPAVTKRLGQAKPNSVYGYQELLYFTTTADSLYALNKPGKIQNVVSLPKLSTLNREIAADQNHIYLADKGKIFTKEIKDEHWVQIEIPKKVFAYHPKFDMHFYASPRGVIASHNRYLFSLKDGIVEKIMGSFDRNVVNVVPYGKDHIVQVENAVFWLQESRKTKILDFDSLQEVLPLEIASSDSIAWLLFKKGNLYRFKKAKLEELRINADVLRKTKIFSCQKEDLMVIGKSGLLRITPKSLNEFKVESYTRPSLFNTEQFWQFKKDFYWHFEGKGLIKRHLDDFLIRQKAPNISEILLQINGNQTYESESEIPASHNFLKLSFKSISFGSPNENYRYRIDGINNDWQQIDNNELLISHLEGGTYVLEVQARNNNEKWSRSTIFSLKVNTPFYKSWWFIGALLFLILLILLYYARFKLYMAMKQSELEMDKLKTEQLLLRSQMNPHFISNTVASIKFLIMKNRNHEANQFLTSFAGLMRKTFAYSRLETVSLKDEIEFIEQFLDLNQSKLDQGFEYAIHVDPKLPQEIRIPTFLIQPLVENALHHGIKNSDQKGTIQVHIGEAQNNNFIYIQVKDSGVGIKQTNMTEKELVQKNTSLSIVITRLRKINQRKQENILVRKLKGSGNQKGTEITIYIKKLENESTNN